MACHRFSIDMERHRVPFYTKKSPFRKLLAESTLHFSNATFSVSSFQFSFVRKSNSILEQLYIKINQVDTTLKVFK